MAGQAGGLEDRLDVDVQVERRTHAGGGVEEHLVAEHVELAGVELHVVDPVAGHGVDDQVGAAVGVRVADRHSVRELVVRIGAVDLHQAQIVGRQEEVDRARPARPAEDHVEQAGSGPERSGEVARPERRGGVPQIGVAVAVHVLDDQRIARDASLAPAIDRRHPGTGVGEVDGIAASRRGVEDQVGASGRRAARARRSARPRGLQRPDRQVDLSVAVEVAGRQLFAGHVGLVGAVHGHAVGRRGVGEVDEGGERGGAEQEVDVAGVGALVVRAVAAGQEGALDLAGAARQAAGAENVVAPVAVGVDRQDGRAEVVAGIDAVDLRHAQRSGIRQVDPGRQGLAAEDHVDGAGIGAFVVRTVRLIGAEKDVALAVAVDVAAGDPDAEAIAGLRAGDLDDALLILGQVDVARAAGPAVVEEHAAAVVAVAVEAVVVLGADQQVRHAVAVDVDHVRLVAEQVAGTGAHDRGDVRRFGRIDDDARDLAVAEVDVDLTGVVAVAVRPAVRQHRGGDEVGVAVAVDVADAHRHPHRSAAGPRIVDRQLMRLRRIANLVRHGAHGDGSDRGRRRRDRRLGRRHGRRRRRRRCGGGGRRGGRGCGGRRRARRRGRSTVVVVSASGQRRQQEDRRHEPTRPRSDLAPNCQRRCHRTIPHRRPPDRAPAGTSLGRDPSRRPPGPPRSETRPL